MGAGKTLSVIYNFVLLMCACFFFVVCFFSHRLVAEESDSDSDEDLEGAVRHDLMMADEKVHVEPSWWHP